MTPQATQARPQGPSAWIATWFGAGYLAKAPGTWGSLAALPLAWAIQATLDAPGLLVATGLVFGCGLWATSRFLRESDERDPSSVVVDEVAGQWLTLLAAPPTLLGYGLGFLLFRLFDIVKPWPIRAIERRVGGALGVMLDDLFAGLCAFLVLMLMHTVFPMPGVEFP
jgi:phosphatidylglycerophosphatase A